MTRDQYVEICSRCLNRKFDAEQGVICSLSNKVADFQQECGEYKLDSNALTKTPVYERIPTQEEVGRLPSDALEKMRAQQDLGFAVIGGFAAAVVGAIFWAAVTVATNYQIGYMAVVVGLLVGFSVRYFGSGAQTENSPHCGSGRPVAAAAGAAAGDEALR